MGEVYRARDERLDRDVALKVLPERVADDQDRLRRFEQEAKATGSLNHPNILVIYDIGSHAGSPFIVSELLEGRSLRDVLRAGRIPLRRVLEYATQVASGLAAAHRKGIAHRDLKPENLFVCKDGRIKILDFGLAKLLQHDDPVGTDDDTKVRDDANTGTGMILGTVGYMAPEQVRGEATDARADIFSFGTVLYEMCTGRRAFQSASSVETMNAILTAEPPPIDPTDGDIPPELERVIGHCLEKEMERRFQTADDLAFSLRGIAGTSGSAVTLAPEDAPASARGPLLLLAIAVAMTAAGLLSWQMINRPDVVQEKPVFKRLTFRSGIIPSANFAPDGQTIVYAAGYEGEPVQVFSTRVEGPESRSLGLGRSGVWSVSSRGMLALSLGCQLHWGYCTGTLAEVSLSGGAPRELLENVEFAEWDPEGENLAVVRAVEGVYRIEYPIGNVIFITDGWITDLAFSPDGQSIAFCEHPVIGLPGGNVSIVDRQGERRILSDGWTKILGLVWTPDGAEIWFNANRQSQKAEIMAIDLTGRERVVYRSGPEIFVTDISPEGRALLTTIEGGSRMVGRTSGNGAERVYSWFDWSTVADLSDDGSTILFYEWGDATQGEPTIYVRSSEEGDAVRLDEGKPLALSPDASRALAIQGDPPQLVALPTGPGQKISFDRSGIRDFYAAEWLPDGDTVLFIGEGEDYVARTYLQAFDGGPARQIFKDGTLGAIVSPDGQRVAAYRFDGSFQLCGISDETCTPLHGLEPGDHLLQWSEEGDAIFVKGSSDISVDLFRLDLASSRRSPWKTLAPSDPVGIYGIGDVRLTPDGESYVYTYWRALNTLYLAEGLK